MTAFAYRGETPPLHRRSRVAALGGNRSWPILAPDGYATGPGWEDPAGGDPPDWFTPETGGPPVQAGPIAWFPKAPLLGPLPPYPGMEEHRPTVPLPAAGWKYDGPMRVRWRKFLSSR